MGCDGGTIPKRHELVRTKQKPEQKDKDSDRATLWQCCALSNQRLQEPIVSCELGRLYNKDTLIELLLDKTAEKVDKITHIKGLKDIHTLNLTKNPAWKDKARSGHGYIDTHTAKFICPIAGIEMNGKYRFCYLITCKCVISEKALKEVRESICPMCSKRYEKENDVVIINGDEDEEGKLREKIKQRKKAAKALKKSKSSKSKPEKGTDVEHLHSDKTTAASEDKTAAASAGPSTSSKPTSNTNVKGLTNRSVVMEGKHKLDEEKIYQTHAFKSLFTSHPSAKRAKDKNGHWITYNPYHYSG